MKSKEIFPIVVLYLFLTSIVLYNFGIGHWYDWARWECNKWRPWYNLAEKYLNRRDIPQAIYHYSMAIEAAPDRWEAYANRATCWMTIRDFDLAIADYEMTLEKMNLDKVINGRAELEAMIKHNINQMKKGKPTPCQQRP